MIRFLLGFTLSAAIFSYMQVVDHHRDMALIKQHEALAIDVDRIVNWHEAAANVAFTKEGTK